MPDSTKKKPQTMSVAFSLCIRHVHLPSRLQRSQRMYLVRISSLAPCGRNRETISPERERTLWSSPMNVQHCTWLGSPMCAAGGGSSTWGNTWESRREGAEETLCIRYVHLPNRLQRSQRLYLVRIFSAARCAGFRQKNFPSPQLRVTSKTYVKISPFQFIEKSPPDVARICEDCLNVFCLTAPSCRPWRMSKSGTRGTEFPI